MSKVVLSNNTHDRPDFIPFILQCIICLRIERRKSKLFSSCFSLKHHLTICHTRQDEIIAEVTREEILEVTRAITKSLEWNMIVDLPKEKSC